MVEVRRAAPEDLPAMRALDDRAFGGSWEDADFALASALIEPDRFLLAVEDDEVVGITGSYPMTMTVPGGATTAFPGVTWVGVALHQRRRGVLRRLFERQHAELAAQGLPLAALTASEATIYGRFGYGPATTDRAVEVDRRAARVREGAPGGRGARHVSRERAREHAVAVHERWCAQTPGAVARSAGWWDWRLSDVAGMRQGGTPLFHLVCPDGWAAYSARDDGEKVVVTDLFAASAEAHAALWRSLLALDLVRTITTSRLVPLDDPLPHLLVDARAVRTTGLRDGMWVRLLDVPAALALRTYACEVDVVLDVVDGGGLASSGSGVDASARVRLRGGPDGATCERTDAAADVRLGVAALGSAYLGGHRLSTLARAGLAEADDPARLARLGAALLADREPAHGTGF